MPDQDRQGVVSSLPPIDDLVPASRTLWWRAPGLLAVVAAVLVGVLGVVLTSLQYRASREQMLSEAHAEFDQLASEAAHRVQRRFELPLYGLKGLRGLHAASSHVDAREFQAYVESHDLAREFPGMLGMGLVERVDREALGSYTAAVRKTDGEDFAVRTSGDQSDLYILRYMVPDVPGTQVQGYDMGQESVRRQSLEAAWRSGELTLSPALQIGAGSLTQPGVLYFLPLYRAGSPLGSEVERRSALQSILVAPVSVERLMAGVLDAGERRLSLELHDGKVVDGGRRLFGTLGAPRPTDSAEVLTFTATRALAVGQRVFYLSVWSGPSLVPAHGTGRSGLVLAAGTLLTLAACLMVYIGWRLVKRARNASHRIRALSFDVNRMATIVDMTDNGIVLTNIEGRIVWANSAFAKRAGWPLDEVLGRRPRELIGTERDNPAEYAAMRQRAMRGESCRIETFCRSRQGEGFHLDIELQPWRDLDGQVMGLVQIGTDITSIRAAQQELESALARADAMAEELRKMATVAERTFGAVLVTDLKLRIQWVNRAFEQLTGYSAAEAIGRTPQELTDFDKTDPVTVVQVNAALRAGRAFKGQALQRSKDGREYWVEFEAHTLTNDAGERIGFMGVETDITERKLAAEALAREQARLANIVEGTHAGEGEWNLRTREMQMSPRWAEMLGFAPEEVRSMTVDLWFELVHPEDQPMLESIALRHLRGEAEQIDVEVRMRHRNRQWRWIHVRGRGVARNSRGNFEWVSGTQIDVTERKRAEQIWHARAEMSGDWYWQTDARHRLVQVDYGRSYPTEGGAIPSDRNLLGRRRDEIDAFDPPAEGWDAFHGRMDRRESFKGIAYRIRRPDGRVGWIEADGRPRINDDGEFIGYEGVGRDITDRQRITEELRDSLALVDALFEFIPVPVLLKDRHGRVVRANKAYGTLLGEPVDTIIGQTSEEFLEPAVARQLAALHTRLLESPGVLTTEVTYRTRSGRQFDALVSKASMTDAQGVTQALIVTVVDISVQKAAARALEEAKGAAESANNAKSAFLASMSHEIRTPMNGVVGMAQVLFGSPLTSDQQRMARTISESAMALLRVIDDILDFSKIEAGRIDLESSVLDLSPLVEGVCESLAPMAVAGHVLLTAVIDPEVLDRVLGDSTRIRQVLNNLVGNAIKFSANQAGRMGQVMVHADIDGPLVRIRVRDNGIGMSEATLGRLFRSFSQGEVSTTRRFGGTGLGLAISKRLVELMGGRIDVQSQLGQGSTFTLHLPLLPAADQPALALPLLTDLDCVLVGAEALPVQVLADWLDRAGAHVRVAAHCEAAARLVQASQDMVIVVAADGACKPAMVEGLPQWRQLVVGRLAGAVAPRVGPHVARLDLLARSSFVHAVARLAHRESAEVIARVSSEAARLWEPVAAPGIAQARAQGQLVLVAEDEPINRTVCQRQLAMLGYACELAENGAQALQMWRNGRYALLISDMNMPEMDGYELARQIRAQEALSGRPRMPIVALTANALKGESQHALAAGMDDYLTKPTSLELLRAALQRWMPAAGNVPAGPQA